MLCRDLRGFRGLARLELSRLKVADQLTDLHDAGSIVGIDHDGIADPIKPDRAPAAQPFVVFRPVANVVLLLLRVLVLAALGIFHGRT